MQKKTDLRIRNIPVDLEWTVKLEVEGRLDSNTAIEFEKTIETILSGSVDYLILDLAKLKFISSAGIGALVMTNKRLAANDGKVIVTNMQPQIAKVMEVLQQLPGWNVFANEEEADKFLTEIQEQILKKKKES